MLIAFFVVHFLAKYVGSVNLKKNNASSDSYTAQFPLGSTLTVIAGDGLLTFQLSMQPNVTGKSTGLLGIYNLKIKYLIDISFINKYKIVRE